MNSPTTPLAITETSKYIQEFLVQSLVVIDGKEAIKVPLSKGLFTLIDLEDYSKVKVYPWYAKKCGNIYYAINDKVGKLHRYLLIISINLLISMFN